MTQRGLQSDRFLKLSHDRKVSPRGWYQKSRDRWVATIPNSFGLPAGTSCPGKTEFCESCYAVISEQSKGVQDLVEHNYRLLTEAGTVGGMVYLLHEMMGRYLYEADKAKLDERDRVFRIHWDGDFFSLDYARAWAEVIALSPSVKFWAYTRSFIEPVNVVPVLTDIDNLALYLSVDHGNVEEARRMSSSFDIRMAYCAADFRSCRELAAVDDVENIQHRLVVCPENAEKMPLMGAEGRGACVDCRLCIDGRADVMFSTSHREDASVAPLRSPTLRSHRPPGVQGRELEAICAYEPCGRTFTRPVRKGRPAIYCSRDCQVRAYYERTHSRPDDRPERQLHPARGSRR